MLKWIVAIYTFCSVSVAFASVVDANVHVGVIGELIQSFPSADQRYQAWRFPLLLDLKMNGPKGFSVHLGLEVNSRNYLLGNTWSVNTPQMPFVFQSFPNGNRPVSISSANVTYASPIGLFQVGRFVRNWGLGIWYSGDWNMENNQMSLSDGLAWSLDFLGFNTRFIFEKAYEGNPFSHVDDADGFTFELRSSDAQVNADGFHKDIGVAFSNINQISTKTELNLVDFYGKFHILPFFIGFEVAFPTKSTTRNTQWLVLGGQGPCPNPEPGEKSLTCSAQDWRGLSALVQGRYAFNLLESKQSVGLKWGYVSGDKVLFEPKNTSQSTLGAFSMHPHERPAILMYSYLPRAVAGMPVGNYFYNTTFIKADYLLALKEYGSIHPAFIYGLLSKTSSLPTGYGRDAHLGWELDVDYQYVTGDGITLGTQGAVWLVGNAWKNSDQALANPIALGLQVYAQTEF